jgi:N-methylhydantoinase A
MEAQLYAQFAEDGVPRDQISLSRFGDLRYVGQGYELRASFPGGTFGEAELERTWQEFHDIHEAEYGHFFADSPIEIVNIRVSGIGITPKIGKPGAVAGGSLDDAHVSNGRCVFRHEGKLEEFETAFYRRDALPSGQSIEGPAIILQSDSTTVVPPGCTLTAEPNGNLIIRLPGASDS